MLGISYLELLFVLGLSSVILGPKDLPRVARHVGQATGRAAAYLTLARSKFARFSEDAKLDKLHVEMQQSMQQLSAIQSELRGNINFMNPGPLARKAMQMPPSEEDPSKFATSSLNPAWRRSQPSQAHHGTNQSYHPTASSFAASAANTAAALGSTFREASTVLHEAHSQEPGEQLTPLPLSAVAIGKAPSREDTTPTGSDILLDALQEEAVAAQAQQFLDSERGQAVLKGGK
ncbi:hypothetical protein ABBQ38_005494 [Trebouxia sp. C0009 RCD-2024]